MDLPHWDKTTLSPCRRFHQWAGQPLYAARFGGVEKFHEPGLAAVYDQSGAYHIDTTGSAAYAHRFLESFGFYAQRAAVRDKTGYYHIAPSGSSCYSTRYQWIGNYQEERCVVQEQDRFFHIDLNGARAYLESYDYVGDFKEGAAVVYRDGQAIHIDPTGRLLYPRWYKQLYVFHKGYAAAEDATGWFHIDRKGHPLYQQRFKMVEPFYNGKARVETFGGIVEQINHQGEVVMVVTQADPLQSIDTISAEFASFWKIYLVDAAENLNLFYKLPAATAVLAAQLGVRQENLIRLLRALWEMGWLHYDSHSAIWQLAEKGHFFTSRPFLAQASAMWAKVATLKNWLKLADLIKQPMRSSFPSFKEKENVKKKKIQYYKALLGYGSYDLAQLQQKVALQGIRTMLLFGVRNLAWIDAMETTDKEIDYYNVPPLPQPLFINTKIKPKSPERLLSHYEVAIFCQFLQNYDDAKVIDYLQLVKKKKIIRLWIIETIVADDRPMGGMVDINIMVETGGKLRTREQWTFLLAQVGIYKIGDHIFLTDYLSLLDVHHGER